MNTFSGYLGAATRADAGDSRTSGIGARLEMAFCFVALSTFLGAYATIPPRLLGEPGLQGGESNPFNAASMAFVLAGTLALIAVHWRPFLAVARLGGPVNLFVAMAVASTLWSFDPAVTLRRSLSLLQIVLFAYYLVARFPMPRIIGLLAAVYATAFVASAALAMADPYIGIMHDADVDGAWCGIFEHKSALGSACALGVLCLGWQWLHAPKHRLRTAAALLLGIALAVLSHSKTGQLTIVLLLPIAGVLHLLRQPGLRQVWALYALTAAALAGAAALLLFFTDITQALGKDATLTGRIPVWNSLLEFSLSRPLGGYGYTGFFVLGNPDVEDVWRHAGWRMWSAHNTPLGLLLELGLPGLLLSAWTLAGLLRAALRAMSAGSAPWAGFAAIYLVSNLPISLVEMILFRGDINSALIPMFYVALRHHAIQARPSAALWRPITHPPQR